MRARRCHVSRRRWVGQLRAAQPPVSFCVHHVTRVASVGMDIECVYDVDEIHSTVIFIKHTQRISTFK